MFNSRKQFKRLVSSNSVSAVVRELNFNRIESRHVVEPTSPDFLDAPAVVPAVSNDSGGIDVVDAKPFPNEPNTE